VKHGRGGGREKRSYSGRTMGEKGSLSYLQEENAKKGGMFANNTEGDRENRPGEKQWLRRRERALSIFKKGRIDMKGRKNPFASKGREPESEPRKGDP